VAILVSQFPCIRELVDRLGSLRDLYSLHRGIAPTHIAKTVASHAPRDPEASRTISTISVPSHHKKRVVNPCEVIAITDSSGK
ncbi:uncharacterized protein METZ01_LOCUS423889, partial [marine metagenome]